MSLKQQKNGQPLDALFDTFVRTPYFKTLKLVEKFIEQIVQKVLFLATYIFKIFILVLEVISLFKRHYYRMYILWQYSGLYKKCL